MKSFESINVNDKITIKKDAFAHGQIQSKIWLCENLERWAQNIEVKSWSIRLYGAWVGILPFLLLSRGRLNIKKIDLFDLDSDSLNEAKKILNFWECEGNIQLVFHNLDVNYADWKDSDTNLVINTSCEHMNQNDWWNNIPNGTYFALQSTDMPHPTHVNKLVNIDLWKKNLDLAYQIDCEFEKSTQYPDKSFKRAMLIGKKMTRNSYSRFKFFNRLLNSISPN